VTTLNLCPAHIKETCRGRHATTAIILTFWGIVSRPGGPARETSIFNADCRRQNCMWASPIKRVTKWRNSLSNAQAADFCVRLLPSALANDVPKTTNREDSVN
jgi:hypothetical protein